MNHRDKVLFQRVLVEKLANLNSTIDDFKQVLSDYCEEAYHEEIPGTQTETTMFWIDGKSHHFMIALDVPIEEEIIHSEIPVAS